MDKILITAIAIVLIIVLKIWFWGSLITSSVKSVGGNCGTSYGIEGKLISGNWFCPNKE